MANQSQPRPRFRSGPMIRPFLGPPPSPAPAPAPAPRPATAPLLRPSMIRPPFRPPVAAPPQLAQGAAVPPRLLTRIADTSPGTQNSPPRSPVTQNSPITRRSPSYASPSVRKSPLPAPPDTRKSRLSSPVAQDSSAAFPASQDSSYASLVTRRSPPSASSAPLKSPLSTTPVTQRSPSAPSSPVTHNTLESPTTKKSPLGSGGTENYSSTKPKTQSPPPSILSSVSIKQEVPKSVPNSPPKYGASLSVSKPNKPLPETLPKSPNIKPAPHSPPSFSLPPSQLHSEGEYEREIPAIAEQKTVQPRSFPKSHRDNPNNSPGGINLKSKELETKRGSNSEDMGMRVITISGENRGAVMELGYSPGTHSTPYQLRSNGESSQGNSSRNEGRSNHTGKAIPSKPMHAFMNNNVQGINSSVVFNSTLSFHDPGIHFCLSRKPDSGHLKGHANEQNLFSD